MKTSVMSYELGAPLTKALGLPDRCTSFTLRLEVMKPVVVECTYYPPLDAKELVAALAEYELVKREPAPAKEPQHSAAAMGFDAWMRNRTDIAHKNFMFLTAMSKGRFVREPRSGVDRARLNASIAVYDAQRASIKPA
jgi:hypothetical protein